MPFRYALVAVPLTAVVLALIALQVPGPIGIGVVIAYATGWFLRGHHDRRNPPEEP